MNIVEIQDDLKNYSDEQLTTEMTGPSGQVPQFLVLSELTRRKRMRDEFNRKSKDNTSSVADDMLREMAAPSAGGVPQGGIGDMAQAMAPQTDVAMNTAQEPQGFAEGGRVRGVEIDHQVQAPVMQTPARGNFLSQLGGGLGSLFSGVGGGTGGGSGGAGGGRTGRGEGRMGGAYPGGAPWNDPSMSVENFTPGIYARPAPVDPEAGNRFRELLGLPATEGMDTPSEQAPTETSVQPSLEGYGRAGSDYFANLYGLEETPGFQDGGYMRVSNGMIVDEEGNPVRDRFYDRRPVIPGPPEVTAETIGRAQRQPPVEMLERLENAPPPPQGDVTGADGPLLGEQPGTPPFWELMGDPVSAGTGFVNDMFSPVRLGNRIEELKAELEVTDDPNVRRGLQAKIASMEADKGTVESIGRGVGDLAKGARKGVGMAVDPITDVGALAMRGISSPMLEAAGKITSLASPGAGGALLDMSDQAWATGDRLALMGQPEGQAAPDQTSGRVAPPPPEVTGLPVPETPGVGGADIPSFATPNAGDLFLDMGTAVEEPTETTTETITETTTETETAATGGGGGSIGGSSGGASISSALAGASPMSDYDKLREQQKWLSLAQFGLGLMASEEANLFRAAGQAGQEALGGYAQGIGALGEEERAQQMAMAKMAARAARGGRGGRASLAGADPYETDADWGRVMTQYRDYRDRADYYYGKALDLEASARDVIDEDTQANLLAEAERNRAIAQREELFADQMARGHGAQLPTQTIPDMTPAQNTPFALDMGT